MEEKIKQANPTLHRYLFTVTTFSKLLAMSLFIFLPFIGFYLGMQYQQRATVAPIILNVQKTVTPTSSPQQTPNVKNGIYANKVYGFTFNIPAGYQAFEGTQDDVSVEPSGQGAPQPSIFHVLINDPNNRPNYKLSKFQINPALIKDIKIGEVVKRDDGTSYTRSDDIIVGAIKAYVIEDLNALDTSHVIVPGGFKNVYFIKNGISYWIAGKGDIFNKILAAFKFTK